MTKQLTGTLLIATCLLACEGSPPRPGGTPTPRTDSGLVDTGTLVDGALADATGTDAAAPDADETDAGEDGGIPDSGTPPMTIPDPGNAMNDWGFSVNNVCCSTPSTAYPTGIVTADSNYVQGNIDVSGDFFYVFRAGPALTQLTWTGFMPFDILDLHDGTGLVFGSVITPTSTGPSTGTWPTTPDQIYVLHLHSATTGFF